MKTYKKEILLICKAVKIEQPNNERLISQMDRIEVLLKTKGVVKYEAVPFQVCPLCEGKSLEMPPHCNLCKNKGIVSMRMVVIE